MTRFELYSLAATKGLIYRTLGGYRVATLYTDGKQYNILEHVLVEFLKEGKLYDNVDHKDGDTLNNEPSNLRGCSYSENSMNRKRPSNNTSGEKNVSFVPKKGLWKVGITKQGRKYTRYFKELKDAVSHARIMRKELHGSFARNN